MRTIVSMPAASRPVAIREVVPPRPAEDEMLVEVRSFALNRGEIHLLEERPEWRPGQDISGVVVEPAADGSGPPAGKRVAALVERAGGRSESPSRRPVRGVLPDSASFSEGPRWAWPDSPR
jgi:NADPH:quinone reductase